MNQQPRNKQPALIPGPGLHGVLGGLLLAVCVLVYALAWVRMSHAC